MIWYDNYILPSNNIFNDIQYSINIHFFQFYTTIFTQQRKSYFCVQSYLKNNLNFVTVIFTYCRFSTNVQNLDNIAIR